MLCDRKPNSGLVFLRVCKADFCKVNEKLCVSRPHCAQMNMAAKAEKQIRIKKNCMHFIRIRFCTVLLREIVVFGAEYQLWQKTKYPRPLTQRNAWSRESSIRISAVISRPIWLFVFFFLRNRSSIRRMSLSFSIFSRWSTRENEIGKKIDS